MFRAAGSWPHKSPWASSLQPPFYTLMDRHPYAHKHFHPCIVTPKQGGHKHVFDHKSHKNPQDETLVNRPTRMKTILYRTIVVEVLEEMVRRWLPVGGKNCVQSDFTVLRLQGKRNHTWHRWVRTWHVHTRAFEKSKTSLAKLGTYTFPNTLGTTCISLLTGGLHAFMVLWVWSFEFSSLLGKIQVLHATSAYFLLNLLNINTSNHKNCN